MQKLLIFTLSLHLIVACNAQQKESGTNKKEISRHVGGRCEGCEAIHEYGDKTLSPIDTLPDFHDKGQKIKITGTVYQKDGKTPAEDVILYVYHTNQNGIYPTQGEDSGWGKRHGYIRGWIKTGKDGKYTFYTLKPGAYPGGSNPAHIHLTVKEPGINEYYLSDYLFKGDPYLDESKPDASPRGGSGLLTLNKEGEFWIGRRDIILGKNIPDYE